MKMHANDRENEMERARPLSDHNWENQFPACFGFFPPKNNILGTPSSITKHLYTNPFSHTRTWYLMQVRNSVKSIKVAGVTR